VVDGTRVVQGVEIGSMPIGHAVDAAHGNGDRIG
jgi:hypothetical protein